MCYLLFQYSTTPPAVCISKTELCRLSQCLTGLLSTTLRFHYCTVVLFCCFTIYFFTVHYLLFHYSATPPSVCISKTELCRLSQDFANLLFGHFTTVLLYYLLLYCWLFYCILFAILLFYHTPSRFYLENRTVPVKQGFTRAG